MNPHRTDRVILLTATARAKPPRRWAWRCAPPATAARQRGAVHQTAHGHRRGAGVALLPGVEHRVCGKGFVRECAGAAFEAHVQAAREGWLWPPNGCAIRPAAWWCSTKCAVRCRSGCWASGGRRGAREGLARNGRGADRTRRPRNWRRWPIPSASYLREAAYEQGRPAQRGVEW
jgi:hypothetical protein